MVDMVEEGGTRGDVQREKKREEVIGDGSRVKYWWCTTKKAGGKSERKEKRGRLRAKQKRKREKMGSSERLDEKKWST